MSAALHCTALALALSLHTITTFDAINGIRRVLNSTAQNLTRQAGIINRKNILQLRTVYFYNT